MLDFQEGGISTDIKVRVISNNLREGDFSDPVTFEDVKQPTLSTASLNKATGDNTFLDSNDQELDITDFEITDYINGTEVVITTEDETNLDNSGGNEFIEVNAGVEDYAGNAMNTANEGNQEQYN